MDITDAQWAIIEPLIPKPRRRKDGRGRPWREPRQVLGGILWVLRTGAPWKDLPERYPPYQTCHRRFQHWSRDGTLKPRAAQIARIVSSTAWSRRCASPRRKKTSFQSSPSSRHSAPTIVGSVSARATSMIIWLAAMPMR